MFNYETIKLKVSPVSVHTLFSLSRIDLGKFKIFFFCFTTKVLMDEISSEMAEGTMDKGWLLDPEARLQARIDEQSELICILKKRADALLIDNAAYQKRIERIETTNSDLKLQLNTERTKVSMLASRFDDLADNHTEMIKYKDYHKSSATELRVENDVLRQQNETLFSAHVQEKDREIEEWKFKNQHLYDQIEKLNQHNKSLSGRYRHN